MRLHIGATENQLAAVSGTVLDTPDWIHLGAPEPMDQPTRRTLANGSQQWAFFFCEGDRLPFPDDHFSFAFSEHFLEHLFLCEAASLLRECYRVLQPGACFRIVVPDADLRTYMEPEPIGYTTGDPRWIHPNKHKSRWSIYSLPCLLELTGFSAHGLVYCDRHGEHIIRSPVVSDPHYARCPDLAPVTQSGYIRRFENSLVVDAVKSPAP